MKRRLWAALAAVSLTLLLAGCGGEEAPAKASSGGEDRFTRCMQDNGAEPGVGLGDPGSGDGKGTASAAPDEQRKQQEAMKKCQKYLPDGGTPKPLSPEELDKARAFAKCMRGEGLDFPDPNPTSGGFQGGPGAGVAPVPDGVDMDDPKVQAAYQKCQKKAGGGAGVETGKADA